MPQYAPSSLRKIVLKMMQYLPTKLYLRLRYRYVFHRSLHLDNPQAYSEKLQWLKLYYHPKEYISMADKYAVKQMVAGIIGEEHVIPALGCWERPEDIEWERLPRRFVLKTTNGGGNAGVVVCKDKAALDIPATCQRLRRALKQDIWRENREWHYRHIPPRILIHLPPLRRHGTL